MEFDLGKMQQWVEQAQQQYQAIRLKMQQTVIEAEAGAGMVRVRMNGAKQLLEVQLDPEVVRNDPEMLPDLICAAVNEAGRRVEEALRSELGMLATALPPGFYP